MEKTVLRFQGDVSKLNQKVLRFEDFMKNNMNERMDVDIKSPDNMDFLPSQDEVIDAVGNLIEQVSGWDMEVFKQYVAELFGIEKASHKDIVMWIMLEVNKYHQAEVNIKGEDFVKKNKRDELPFELIELDYAMICEKIYRKLRGLQEDEKPTPTYIKKMVDICKEYLVEDDEEEEE